MPNTTPGRGGGWRRLRLLDRVLLLLFVPAWLGGAGLHLREATNGTLAWVGVVVSASETPGGHPVVSGFQPGWDAEASGLALGDSIISIGGHDLAGAGALRFAAQVRASAGAALETAMVFARDGDRRAALLSLRPVPSPLGYLLVSASFAICGVFVVLRSPASRGAQAIFANFISFAFMMLFFHGENLLVNYVWMALATLSFLFGPPLVLRALLLVPENRYPDPTRSYAWVWAFAAMSLTFSSWLFGFPLSHALGSRAHFFVGGAWYLTALAVIVHSYRRSSPIGRRRAKWYFVGGYICMVPFVVGAFSTLVEPTFWGRHAEQSLVVLVAIPICMLISVSRYNLFDIDRILSATASYNIVLILLAGVGVATVPRLAEATAKALPISVGLAQVALSLGLVSIVIPAQRRLQPELERVFFPDRYAIDRGLGSLLRDLAFCEDPEGLTRLIGERLDTVLQPEACAVYAQEAGAFTPVFIAGQVVPPAFHADGELIATLRKRNVPLVAERFVSLQKAPDVETFDRAALETLDAAIVLPLRRGDTLWAFICLGPKKSTDVYTSTDLRLLRAVTELAAGEFLRFEKDELLRHARAMQESLRTYVPGAIADRLLSGSEVESGEREVSVLFVDLRGYTGLAEGWRAQEVFATVNRYTETVSRIASAHSGSVVEFNGDGMMVVFGAPRPLPDKERAAVAAGREIAAAVAALPVESEAGSVAKLSVGVGIATGEAFVGNIQAVDRAIWSAVGNTTNLAARLQTLSRELDAEVVVDRTTYSRAGRTTDGFLERQAVPIRGRAEPADVDFLPIADSGAS